MAAYQQPTGSRFGADALYHGENRKYGGMITYLYAPTPTENTNDSIQKSDSLILKIYDQDRLIRTSKKGTQEKGFHRWYWNLDEKGVKRPPKKNDKIQART